METDADGFVKVKKSRSKNRGKIIHRQIEIHDDDDDPIDPFFDSKLLSSSLSLSTGPLASCVFSLLSLFPFRRLVCYGVGRVSRCRIARTQLALFLLMKDRARIPALLYDPALSAAEAEAVRRRGVDVLETNEECRRNVAGETTLFFMPHCDRPMYENLLWANWNPEDLQRVVVLGNAFGRVLERTPGTVLEEETPLLAKSARVLEEAPLEADPGVDDDVFNDCGVVFFPAEKIKSVEAEFWRRRDWTPDCTPKELRGGTVSG